jgi:hypothetical protein
MKRRWLLALGILGFIGSIASLAISGFSTESESITVATSIAFAFGSCLFALGGIDDSFHRLDWYHLAGTGQIIVGIAAGSMFLLPILSGVSSADVGIQMIRSLIGAFTALSLTFVGFDWIRGGRHFDLSSYEPEPISVSE